MFLPPILQQPAPKTETSALAALLQKRGAVVSLKRHALGALYGHGTAELESLEATDGTDARKGLGVHVAAEAPKLASGDAETSFTYTSNGGFTMELERGRDGVAFTLRAGRGEAVFATNQIAALRQLIEKAK